MSANIDTMIYVGARPWHGMGYELETLPMTSEEVIRAAKLDWKVNHTPLRSDIHDHVMNYHAIYREDNNQVLGVVNSPNISLVQNRDTFNAVEGLLGDMIDVETAASLGKGETVFGCFKLHEEYKVLDDEVDHYFVIMNDHLKTDGKVTCLNTPVRVVCQNTLSAALSRNFYQLRVPITSNQEVNSKLAANFITSAKSAIHNLQGTAMEMVKEKIDRDYVNKILDELFPYIKTDGNSSHDRANEVTEMLRSTFVTKCMKADNLANYKGTKWQVLNAYLDFDQHYFRKADHTIDLNRRMQKLPGIGNNNKVIKLTKILRQAA